MHTDETKRKIAEKLKDAHKRNKNWGGYFKVGHGDLVPSERRKIAGMKSSKKLMGRVVSQESRLKMSISAKKRGATIPRKGKIISCKQCKKEKYIHPSRSTEKRKTRFCSKECAYKARKGISFSPSTQFKKGKLSLNWKGGVSKDENYKSIQGHIRNCRLARVGGKFSAFEWNELKKKYDYSCIACGTREPEIKLTIDHIIPISRWVEWEKEFGNVGYKCNDIQNIQPLCLHCNVKKNNKLFSLEHEKLLNIQRVL